MNLMPPSPRNEQAFSTIQIAFDTSLPKERLLFISFGVIIIDVEDTFGFVDVIGGG